jgi:hypothetical protein
VISKGKQRRLQELEEVEDPFEEACGQKLED